MKNSDIECSSAWHSDLSITWYSFYKGNLSPKDKRGHIAMKYSSVPDFLYILGKTLSDFSFLDERVRNSILQDDRKSPFSDSNYKEIASQINHRKLIYQAAFTGKFKDGDKEIIISENDLKNMRYGRRLEKIIELVQSKCMGPEKVTYHGNIVGSPEYPNEVHAFSPDDNVWIAQNRGEWGKEEVHAMSLNDEDTKDMISDIIEMYGDSVYQGLRIPIENSMRH